MTLQTLVKFLLGNREAILQIATSRQALGLGLLFVLAAGFAREYDGEDLLAEPWHLLIPLAASVVSSAVLYLLVRIVAWFHKATDPPLASGYLDFLGLYWMTAPLALLYAIPFERFLSAPDSVRANLGLLALVATWRVLLMARVVSVIYAAPLWTALATVMLFGQAVVLLVLELTPVPILSLMGGIRLSESEQLIQIAALGLAILCFYTLPIWAISVGVALIRRKHQWRYQPIDRPGSSVAWGTWGFAAVSLFVWVLLLPVTQPEQQLRRQVERDLRAGRLREALTTMSAHEWGDFPPHWDPPPRLAYGERRPDILDIQETLQTTTAQPWVFEAFTGKFLNQLQAELEYPGWTELSTDQVARRLTLLESLPNRQEVVRNQLTGLQFLAQEDVYDTAFPVDLHERIKKLCGASSGERSTTNDH